MKKHLPTDLNTFSSIIKGGYLYVDKTEQISRLFSTGKRYFFLSRPRRFGKSLLLSTIKSLFLGEKELFADLWLGKQKDFNWQEHPVIHIDFSSMRYRTPEELEENLDYTVKDCANEYGIDVSQAINSKTRLKLLVKKLAKINSVVILIDEYDKPILDFLHNPEKADAQREALKDFYTTFKALDEYLRCIFITGVSKFAKASIFSGLNNLLELSNEPESADLLGYTQEELETFFNDYLIGLAHKQNQSIESTKEKIKLWYNGYQFSKAPIKVYNPYSIGYLFSSKEFNNYWFLSGTPTFLIEQLKKSPLKLTNLENNVYDIGMLGTFQLIDLPLETLLFQSGYLTIKEYDEQYNAYRLTYPNAEIRQSMKLLELGVLTDTNAQIVFNKIFHLRFAFETNNLDMVAKTIRSLLASIPSYLHIEREAYYHSLIQLLCTVLGIETACEVATDKGRIDLVVNAEKYIYIIEFKFDNQAQKALEQIMARKYYEKYFNAGKEIILVGMALNYKDKELSVEWVEGSVT